MNRFIDKNPVKGVDEKSSLCVLVAFPRAVSSSPEALLLPAFTSPYWAHTRVTAAAWAFQNPNQSSYFSCLNRTAPHMQEKSSLLASLT